MTNSVQQAKETPTFKHWFQIDGRNYLMEEVPYQRVAAQLSQLPAVTSRQNVISTKLYAANTFLEALPARLLTLPAPGHVPAKSEGIRMARTDGDQLHGLVLDYVTVNSGGNYTFQGDTTYYISGNVSLTGTATVEGGAVLKYASGSQLTLTYPPVWQASAYRPVILTAKDDNTVGETISGSTGSPSGYYASCALSFFYPPTTISNFRISYAQTAMMFNYGGNPVFSNGQLVNCQDGFDFESTLYVNIQIRNMLFANVVAPFCNIFYSSVDAQNSTFNGVYSLATSSGYGSVSLKNCILANVSYLGITPSGNNNGFYRSPPFGTSTFTNTFSPFQTAGAGSFYLTNGCNFLNAGATNIDPALLAGLKQKTTWPPILLSNITISVNTNLSPQAGRDTNSSPNLGYHYDPIDYIADLCAITNATLTLTNGVALATYNEAGIKLQDNSAIVSIGSPLYPNWFARYSSVQEQSVALGGTNNNGGMDVYPSYTSARPNGTYQFTKFACPAGGGFHLDDYSTASYGSLNVQECEFWGGTNVLGGTSGTTLLLDNNLFARSCIGAAGSGSLSFSNNLVWGTASARLNPSSGTVWYAFNNAFDSTTLAISILTNGYNAYLNCPGHLIPINSSDIFSASTLAYKSGWLGTFYQPTTSLLINMGGTTANLLGLYHFTTQTNQVPETNSVVDIGYHYVATDTNGNPLETLWLGVPDYLDDTNGELAAWEMEYFGHTGLDPAALDTDGYTLLYDYTSAIVPANVIQFSIEVTNDYVNHTNVSVQLNVTAGVPSYYAVFVGGSGTTNWLAFTTTNLTVNVGATDGVYDVNVGLKGFATNATQTWNDYSITVDRVAPVMVITNLSSLSGSRPFIDPAGYTTKSLSSLTFDVTNSLGAAYSDQGSVVDQQCNPADMNHATNWFECLDAALTLGTNHIGIHAVDWAGNVTSTNFSYIFDTNGDTTPPAIAMTWPQDGMEVSGTNFTLRGLLDDDTATVSGQWRDTNGVAHIVNGLVERCGQFWLENVPLNPGTNVIAVTATDAAGNSSTTNLILIQSSVSLTMDTVSADQLNQAQVNVTGEISDPTYAVWVNGVQGTNYGHGTWGATNVPVTAGGTASFDMTAYPPGYIPTGNSWTNFAVEDESYPNPLPADPAQSHADWDKPPVVYVKKVGWDLSEYYTPFDNPPYSATVSANWSQGGGGTLHSFSGTDNGYSNIVDQAWPEDAGLVPVLPADYHFMQYQHGSLYQDTDTYTTDHNGLLQYFESITGSGVYTNLSGYSVPPTWAENMGYVVDLFTGGKAIRQSKALFVLSDALTWCTGALHLEVDQDSPVPSPEIALGALGNLGNDGMLYAALDNGGHEVVTPRASHPFLDSDLPGKAKYTLNHFVFDCSPPLDIGRTIIGIGETVQLLTSA